jgi:drug/metabolite transporter (DMT)-like permease
LNTKNQNKSYLFAGLSVLLWSTVATSFKIGLRYQSEIQMLFTASVASMIVIGIFYLNDKPKISDFNFKSLVRSALGGLLNPLLYYVVLFKAYNLLPAQEAQPLNYTWVVVTAVFSAIFLGQRFSVFHVMGLLVSFAGVVVISLKGDFSFESVSNPAGVLLALSSSVIWASYWIINVKDNRKDSTKLFLNFLFGSMFCLFYLLFTGEYRYSHEALLSGIYIGFAEMGLTFIFWLKALKYSENNAKTGNIIYFSPFISLIFIQFILGESILLSSITGLALIVAGVVIQQVKINFRAA